VELVADIDAAIAPKAPRPRPHGSAES
jgi:hypothetical protein